MKTTLEEDLAILANRANPDSCNADLFRFLEQQHSRVKSSFLGAGRCIPCSLGKEKSPALVPGAEVDLSAATVLAMQFRVYKKLLLWEVLGQLGPPLGCCCESNQTMHGS